VTSGSHTHAARPTDLVALVTFDDEVRRNQAVTLDRLGVGDQQGAHPLNAAIAQWLRLGRRMWINVEGREVRGIATARDLGGKSAWVLDTLIDASGEDAGDEVVQDLLEQAVSAAARAAVTHVLLRVEQDAPAREPAMRAGFRPALPERAWRGPLGGVAPPEGASVVVRPATEADEPSQFRLYSRVLPLDARALLGMTQGEWSALRDRRWLRSSVELVAELEGEIRGAAAFSQPLGLVQIDLIADQPAVAAALLCAVRERSTARAALVLVPPSVGAVEAALRDGGFEAGESYMQLCRRMARPIQIEATAAPRVPVPSGGGA
jgi:hypothetical protein